MLNKHAYTHQLLTQLTLTTDVDTALRTWWANIRESGGLRLTEAGYLVFDSLDIERWEFEVAPRTFVVPSNLLILDKKLTCPYYIKLGRKSQLIMFGSREATTLALYGDIEKFINNLSRQ